VTGALLVGQEKGVQPVRRAILVELVQKVKPDGVAKLDTPVLLDAVTQVGLVLLEQPVSEILELQDLLVTQVYLDPKVAPVLLATQDERDRQV
jgi:hypothetical protein